jgi:beta-N-acetylhexosaminidase
VKTRSAQIFGCAGKDLSADERAFFRETRPFGFILFARNLESADQTARLVAALRETVEDATAPVLIDQEGGRVQRIKPPMAPLYPPGALYGRLARKDPFLGQAFARLGARLIAHDLAALGINVDAVPVLDVPQPGAHDVIGDRAYDATPDGVARLGRAAAEGLIAGGVLPIIKHIPGHGRSMADSHHELPRVTASRSALEAVDFPPFAALSDMPMAMTAHVVFEAFDASAPATTSPVVVDQVIRRAIGFDGLLMSDDLSMKALGGDFQDRARRSLAAGCDVVLHCNGDRAEMAATARAVPALSGAALRRAEAAMARLPSRTEPLDEAEARAQFAAWRALAEA